MTMQNIHIDIKESPCVTHYYIEGQLMSEKMISYLEMLTVS